MMGGKLINKAAAGKFNEHFECFLLNMWLLVWWRISIPCENNFLFHLFSPLCWSSSNDMPLIFTLRVHTHTHTSLRKSVKSNKSLKQYNKQVNIFECIKGIRRKKRNFFMTQMFTFQHTSIKLNFIFPSERKTIISAIRSIKSDNKPHLYVPCTTLNLTLV